MLSMGNDWELSIEFSLYKLAISLPLLWISWFGQRNISQRKRLFEEYNHKLRVVQLYQLFTSDETSYKFNNREELEVVLIDSIRNNPAKHLGKSETMIDGYFDKNTYSRIIDGFKEAFLPQVSKIIDEIKKNASDKGQN